MRTSTFWRALLAVGLIWLLCVVVLAAKVAWQHPQLAPAAPSQPQTTPRPNANAAPVNCHAGAPPTSSPYLAVAQADAERTGVDVLTFERKINQESGYNPNALSRTGAEGIVQFMPATAAGIGIDAWNPQQALEASARLDASHLKPYAGDAQALVAHYGGNARVMPTSWRWQHITRVQEPRRTPGTKPMRVALAGPGSAVALLERQVHLAASSGRTGTLLEIWLLQALAYHQQGDTPRALSILEESLALAEPEGYLRLFIDEGAPMRALLTAWLHHQQSRHTVPATQPRLVACVKKLLGIFGAAPVGQTRARGRRVNDRPATSSLLSEREREILRHLAAGKSNEEIAETLVLAVSTVKWHLTRIYGKLDVQSRTQAVHQAKHFHLL